MQKLQISEFCHILLFIKDAIFDGRDNVSFLWGKRFSPNNWVPSNTMLAGTNTPAYTLYNEF